MKIEQSIYLWMNTLAPYLNLWVACFLITTLIKIFINLINPKKSFSYGTLISELPGLPLTLLHTACFVKAVLALDLISMLLFVWWGPGFIITAVWYIYIKVKKIPFDWTPLGYITSIACKVNYLLFVLIYFYFGCYEILMAFSVWIIHDQINLAWFCNNADRTRRTFEDFWLIRLCYVGFLFTPLIVAVQYRLPSAVLGIVLFIFWLAALYKVTRAGYFYNRPSHQEFLRNIVYLAKKYAQRNR